MKLCLALLFLGLLAACSPTEMPGVSTYVQKSSPEEGLKDNLKAFGDTVMANSDEVTEVLTNIGDTVTTAATSAAETAKLVTGKLEGLGSLVLDATDSSESARK